MAVERRPERTSHGGMQFLVSILCHRRDSGVERCLESVLKGGGDFGLYLVANGPEALAIFRHTACEALGVSVHVQNNKNNLGFIEPNNKALEYASTHGYDILVLLNDDATVPAGWLDRIEAEFKRHPAAAIVGASHTCRTLNEGCDGYEGEQLDYIDGACLAVRVDVVKKHFKTLFPNWLSFAYGEDATLSLLVRRLGYTIHQAQFMIQHARGSTSSKIQGIRDIQKQNHAEMKRRFAYYLKHHRFPARIVVRRWAAAGDVLLTTPVIRRLWEENPMSEIVVETYFPELFDNNPCVAHAGRKIERRPDDWVLDLDMVSENSPMRHFVASYARAAGVDVEAPYKTEIYWREEPETAQALDGAGTWVALHTGPSTWTAKAWPGAKWAELAEQLRQDGLKVVLVGNGRISTPVPHDLDLRDQISSLNALAAHLKRCALFVGLDSAPLHVADCVGTPCIGLFGITSSKFILSGKPTSVGLDADPVLFPRAGERHRVAGVQVVHESGACIGSITPERVFKTATELLKGVAV